MRETADLNVLRSNQNKIVVDDVQYSKARSWQIVSWSNFLNGIPKDLEVLRLSIVRLLFDYVLVSPSNLTNSTMHVAQNLTELKNIASDLSYNIHAVHREIDTLDDYDVDKSRGGGTFWKGTVGAIIIVILIILKLLIGCER